MNTEQIKSPITVSLKEILEAGACKDGFLRVLHARGKITEEQLSDLMEDEDIDSADELPDEVLDLADDEQFAAASVVTREHIQDAIWALRVRPEPKNLWRKYAVWCALQVKHLMKDERSINAIDVAWRHSDGMATDSELSAAGAAAWDAVRAAAWAAVGGAAWAAVEDAQTKKLIEILNAGEWVE